MLKKLFTAGDDILYGFRKTGVGHFDAVKAGDPGRGESTIRNVVRESEASSFANAGEVEGQVGDRFTLGQNFTSFAVKLGKAVGQWLRKLWSNNAAE